MRPVSAWVFLTITIGGVDQLLAQVPCTDSFIKVHGVEDNVMSRCRELGNLDIGNPTLDECIRDACNAGANAFNWNPVKSSCNYRVCDDVMDLNLAYATDTYEVYAVKGLCNKKYKKAFKSTEGMASGCPSLEGSRDDYVDATACVKAGCSAGANTINWNPVDSACNFRYCNNSYDLQLDSAIQGSDIYIQDDLPREPDFRFDCSSIKCAAGGHAQKQPIPYIIDTSYLYILPGYGFDCEGEVSGWEFFADSPGSFLACVYRPNRTENKLTWCGCNELDAKKPGPHAYEVPHNYRISAEPSDVIAIAFRYSSESPVLSATVTGPNNDKVHMSNLHKVSGVNYPGLGDVTFDWENYMPESYSGPKISMAIKAEVSGPPENLRLNSDHDPPNPRLGRVEIKKYDVWGTICDAWWDNLGWPQLFCRCLGYPTTEEVHYMSDKPDFPTPGNEPEIHMQNPRCKASTHNSMFSCWIHPTIGCGHDKDVYIKCAGRVKLVNDNHYKYKGVAVIWNHGQWGTVCDIGHSPSWHMKNPAYSWTTAFCEELGFSGGAAIVEYAQTVIEEYKPMYRPSYPSPTCDEANPTLITSCTPDYKETCSNAHDIYLECKEYASIIF